MEYLYFNFLRRSRRVPGVHVGCFRFRGFAPVGGPNCGGVRPYKATPWVTLLVYPTMCGWSVSQPFLSRSLAVLQPFLSRFSAKNAWLHTVSMGNGDFELFLPVLGSLNAIDSKFCVVTPSTN